MKCEHIHKLMQSQKNVLRLKIVSSYIGVLTYQIGPCQSDQSQVRSMADLLAQLSRVAESEANMFIGL